MEELREPGSRRGILGWLRSGYEGTYRRSVKPLPLRRAPGDYDLVFVGSPTWSRALASPVRGFLAENAADLRHVALFATCSGRGATEVIAEMAALLGGAPLATLAMLERDVKRGPAVEVGEFIETALCAWEAKSTPP